MKITEKNKKISFVSFPGYSGEYKDLSSGTYYLRARYYSPSTGRFLAEDTLHSMSQKMPNGQELVYPLSLNLYTYCWNNPILYVDQSGNAPYVKQSDTGYEFYVTNTADDAGFALSGFTPFGGYMISWAEKHLLKMDKITEGNLKDNIFSYAGLTNDVVSTGGNVASIMDDLATISLSKNATSVLSGAGWFTQIITVGLVGVAEYDVYKSQDKNRIDQLISSYFGKYLTSSTAEEVRLKYAYILGNMADMKNQGISTFELLDSGFTYNSTWGDKLKQELELLEIELQQNSGCIDN